MKKKETHWFSHDQNAFNDPKIELLTSKYGYAGYGRWWHLIEILRGETNYKYAVSSKYGYVSLAKKLGLTLAKANEFIIDCIEFELLRTDELYLWSDSLMNRMEYWDNRRIILSERGKKGGENSQKKQREKKEVNISSSTSSDTASSVSSSGDSTIVEAVVLINQANETKQNETKQNNKEEEVIPPTTPTTNFISSEAVLPIATLQQNVMNDEIYFVTPICMQFGIEPEKVNQWLTAFNKQLGAEAQHYKTPRDYRKHFLHWLKYQDVARGDPAKWKPVTNPKQQKGTNSPPPQPTAEEILAQRAADREYYANKTYKPKD